MSKLDKFYDSRSSDKRFQLLHEETSYLGILKEQEPNVKIPVEHPGMLEVPEGKNVEDLPYDHFAALAKKKGFEKISRALNNLHVWNKDRNPELASWANKMQEKLSNEFSKEATSEAVITEAGVGVALKAARGFAGKAAGRVGAAGKAAGKKAYSGLGWKKYAVARQTAAAAKKGVHTGLTPAEIGKGKALAKAIGKTAAAAGGVGAAGYGVAKGVQKVRKENVKLTKEELNQEMMTAFENGDFLKEVSISIAAKRAAKAAGKLKKSVRPGLLSRTGKEAPAARKVLMGRV